MAKQTALAEGLDDFTKAFLAVVRAPLRYAAWLIALAVSTVLAPVWGSVPLLLGWVASRQRILEEGVVGVGEVLAPDIGQQQYEKGVWRGFWRVHTLTFVFLVLQLAPQAFVYAPAVAARFLLAPFEEIFQGEVSTFVGLGLAHFVPGLVGLVCTVFAATQTFVLLRVLGACGPRYPTGLVFKAVGVSYAAVLASFKRVLGLALLLVGAAIVATLLLVLTIWIAGQAGLSDPAARLLITWVAAILGALFVASMFESLVVLAAGLTVASVPGSRHFSFSDWLWGWLSAVFGWFADQGIVAVGIGVCLALGVATGVMALVTGMVFTSWIGLGWFAVTAAVLVVLRIRGA